MPHALHRELQPQVIEVELFAELPTRGIPYRHRTCTSHISARQSLRSEARTLCERVVIGPTLFEFFTVTF